jgi:hypothetical protein
MLDLLVSASVVVPDFHSAVRFVVEELGFPQPRPTWMGGGPQLGFDYAFMRVDPSMAIAPTRLELIHPLPFGEPADPNLPRFYTRETIAVQGNRPIRTHATVTASSEFGEVIERVRRSGARHRVDPVTEANPFSRLWLGVTEDDPAGYRGEELFLEVVETQSLMLKPETYQDPPPLPDNPAPGQMIRIVSRGYLLTDLDAYLKRLANELEWEPPRSVENVPGLGRRAQMIFGIGHSATLYLLEPASESDAGRFIARWGPGPYSVRIAVNDLDAKADALREKGVSFSRDDSILRIEPTPTLGTVLELVEVHSPN